MMTRDAKIAVATGCGVIVAIFIFAILHNNKQSTTEPVSGYALCERLQSDAAWRAPGIVRDYLKAPSTAKFEGTPSAKLVSPANYPEVANIMRMSLPAAPIDCMYAIVGQVDAQNSFGAMLRREYNVVLYVERGSTAVSHWVTGI